MFRLVKNYDYLCSRTSEMGNVRNAVKIVHDHTNSSFEWLISGHQRVNFSREGISILSWKYKRVTFVHPVSPIQILKSKLNQTVNSYLKSEKKFNRHNLLQFMHQLSYAKNYFSFSVLQPHKRNLIIFCF